MKLDQINSRIMAFNYGQLDSDHRPSIIDLENTHLGQGGQQMLNLFLRVNFIFDDLRTKPDMEDKFLLIATVVKIWQILSATTVTEEDLSLYDSLVEKLFNLASIHLREWDKTTKTFKKFNATPKLHNFLHGSDVTRKLGPTCHLSTLRYECKHKVFKGYAHSVPNQNAFLSYAFTRHQEEWAVEWANTQEMVQIESSKEFDVPNPYSIFPDLEKGHILNRVKWIEYFHTYARGLFIFVANQRHNFFQISDLFTVKDEKTNTLKYFIQCRTVEVQFDNFYNAFEIVAINVDSSYFDIQQLHNNETFESIRSRSTAKDFIFIKKNICSD